MKRTTNKLMTIWQTSRLKLAAYRNVITLAFTTALIAAFVFGGQTRALAAASYFDAILGAKGLLTSFFLQI